ncbi:MAG TPA: organomercurial lyase [Thermoanaerobaculia bacterium]|jgi:hypothetical protein
MDEQVRFHVYDVTMREGAPPSSARVAELAGVSHNDARAALQRLADAHMLVLQRSGEILMAGPFSAVPTPFRVTLPRFTCYGNCIWDALGIAAMLRENATIDTSCADCGGAAKIEVEDGALHGEGFMHFALPPRQWWADVVFT